MNMPVMYILRQQQGRIQQYLLIRPTTSRLVRIDVPKNKITKQLKTFNIILTDVFALDLKKKKF